jgi:hypothetical protein
MSFATRQCVWCEGESSELERVGVCGWCGHEALPVAKAVTHEEIVVAVAEYLAKGGRIYRLPDQATPRRPAIGVQEDLALGIRLVPVDEWAA